MRVDIEEEGCSILLFRHFLEEEGLRVQPLGNLVPAEVPVHIAAGECAAVVSDDDTIRVKHGHNFEDYFPP